MFETANWKYRGQGNLYEEKFLFLDVINEVF